jgi:hypothetical protein
MKERGEGRGKQALTFNETDPKTDHSWYDRPHDQLVQAFRSYIASERAKLDTEFMLETWTPEAIIEARLERETAYTTFQDKKRRGDFFRPIEQSWRLLTFDRRHESDQHRMAWEASIEYEGRKRRREPHPEIIELTDPLQVRILDALAEAVGMPRRRGQTELEIPEHIRGYAQRLREYHARR